MSSIQLFFFFAFLSYHTTSRAQAHITISVLMKQGGGQLHRSWKPQLKGSRKIVCLTSVWPSLRWPLVLRFWNNSVYGVASHTAKIKGGKGRKPLCLFFSCELTLLKLLKRDQHQTCFSLNLINPVRPDAAYQRLHLHNLIHLLSFIAPYCQMQPECLLYGITLIYYRPLMISLSYRKPLGFRKMLRF